jgi:hypothetical protein
LFTGLGEGDNERKPHVSQSNNTDGHRAGTIATRLERR